MLLAAKSHPPWHLFPRKLRPSIPAPSEAREVWIAMSVLLPPYLQKTQTAIPGKLVVIHWQALFMMSASLFYSWQCNITNTRQCHHGNPNPASSCKTKLPKSKQCNIYIYNIYNIYIYKYTLVYIPHFPTFLSRNLKKQKTTTNPPISSLFWLHPVTPLRPPLQRLHRGFVAPPEVVSQEVASLGDTISHTLM